MDECAAGLIFNCIFLNLRVVGEVNPLVADLLGFLDHFLSSIDLLQIFIIVPDVVGALIEAVILLVVLEDVQTLQRLLLARQQGVYAPHVIPPRRHHLIKLMYNKSKSSPHFKQIKASLSYNLKSAASTPSPLLVAVFVLFSLKSRAISSRSLAPSKISLKLQSSLSSKLISISSKRLFILSVAKGEYFF
jgi:hypothetical protein